jgi:hypothetical protein
VSGTFCAKHPKGELHAKGTDGLVFPTMNLNPKAWQRACQRIASKRQFSGMSGDPAGLSPPNAGIWRTTASNCAQTKQRFQGTLLSMTMAGGALLNTTLSPIGCVIGV